MRLIDSKGLVAACALTVGTLSFASMPVGAQDVIKVAIVNGEISEPLTDTPGDPEAGRAAIIDRKLGNCLACHQNSDMARQPFHGEVGPPLDDVASRYSPAQLRAIIVDPKKVFGPQTVMPAFYVADPAPRVAEKFVGKTILSAQEIEDVVAYLATLKE